MKKTTCKVKLTNFICTVSSVATSTQVIVYYQPLTSDPYSYDPQLQLHIH